MEMATVTNIVNSGPRPYDQDADKPVSEPSWLSLAIVGAFLVWLALMFTALTIIVIAFALAAIG